MSWLQWMKQFLFPFSLFSFMIIFPSCVCLKCPALSALDPWWLKFRSLIIRSWIPRELIKKRIGLDRERRKHTVEMERNVSQGFKRRDEEMFVLQSEVLHCWDERKSVQVWKQETRCWASFIPTEVCFWTQCNIHMVLRLLYFVRCE